MPSLAEHTDALDRRLTKHLLRRACFQYDKALLDEMEGKTASEILTLLTKPKAYAWDWPYDPITTNNQYGSNSKTYASWLHAHSSPLFMERW